MSIGKELRFEVLDDTSGVFVYPEERFDALVEKFDELLNAHQSGGLADKPYVTALQRLLAREPEFVDGHAHLRRNTHRSGLGKRQDLTPSSL